MTTEEMKTALGSLQCERKFVVVGTLLFSDYHHYFSQLQALDVWGTPKGGIFFSRISVIQSLRVAISEKRKYNNVSKTSQVTKTDS